MHFQISYSRITVLRCYLRQVLTLIVTTSFYSKYYQLMHPKRDEVSLAPPLKSSLTYFYHYHRFHNPSKSR